MLVAECMLFCNLNMCCSVMKLLFSSILALLKLYLFSANKKNEIYVDFKGFTLKENVLYIQNISWMRLQGSQNKIVICWNSCNSFTVLLLGNN